MLVLPVSAGCSSDEAEAPAGGDGKIECTAFCGHIKDCQSDTAGCVDACERRNETVTRTFQAAKAAAFLDCVEDEFLAASCGDIAQGSAIVDYNVAVRCRDRELSCEPTSASYEAIAQAACEGGRGSGCTSSDDQDCNTDYARHLRGLPPEFLGCTQGDPVEAFRSCGASYSCSSVFILIGSDCLL